MVNVTVDRHPIFRRQEYDIYSTMPISFTEAALGGEITIKTVDGDVVQTIKPGTQTDTRIRLRGKGVPTLRNKNIRGDHYVTLVVQVPDKLNNEQKDLLRKFEESLNGGKPQPVKEDKTASGVKEDKKKKSFMDKVKKAFDDLDE